MVTYFWIQHRIRLTFFFYCWLMAKSKICVYGFTDQYYKYFAMERSNTWLCDLYISTYSLNVVNCLYWTSLRVLGVERALESQTIDGFGWLLYTCYMIWELFINMSLCWDLFISMLMLHVAYYICWFEMVMWRLWKVSNLVRSLCDHSYTNRLTIMRTGAY